MKRAATVRRFGRRVAVAPCLLVGLMLALPVAGAPTVDRGRPTSYPPAHAGLSLKPHPERSSVSAARDAVADSTSPPAVLVPAGAIPGDEYWSKDFGRRGIYGTVFTACEHAGDLYVGGAFYYAGSTRCNNVARWDGASWHPLSTGVWLDGGGSKVTKVLEYDNNIIVGGVLDYAGGVPLPGFRVARWDGVSWQAMTESAWRDSPGDLFEYEGRLLAAGGFWSPTLGGYAGVLEWTGTEWVNFSPLTAAGRLNLHEGRLLVVVGGSLITWGGSSWDTEPMEVDCVHPEGLAPYIRPTASLGSTLAVGGSFQCAVVGDSVSVPANNVGLWDGTTFTALGGGLDEADYEYWEEAPMVWSLGLWDGDLFAGGDFMSAEGYPQGMRHIGRWDGSAWQPLGTGCSENVYTLLPYDGKLVAGGWMGYAGDQDVWGIASWDGTTWSGFGPVGQGVNNPVYALHVWDDKLIALGQFDRAGSTPAYRIAAFDGESWQPLGGGVWGVRAYNGVLALGTYQGSLIVAGDIAGGSGVTCPHVSRWDGERWWAMGEGLPEAEAAICEYEGRLYIGKYRWNGASWEQWLPADGEVRALVVWDDCLVAAGDFSTVDGVPMSKLVRWDGENFLDVGGGLPSGGIGPQALVVHDGDLIVSGTFTLDGSYGIVRWDGTAWHGFGNGMNLSVTALASQGNCLFVGGLFDGTFNHVAYWDGTGWRKMGNGCTGSDYYRREVKALALYHGALYVGGDFTIAGDAPSLFMAKWRNPLVPVYLRTFGAERRDGTAVVHCELAESLLADEQLEVWRELPGQERTRLGQMTGADRTSLSFTDRAAPMGEADYWLCEVSAGGADVWHGPTHLAAAPLPERLALTSVAPNPFNPRTTIRFALPQDGQVRLAVYDQRGRLVRTLLDTPLAAGYQSAEWDGLDDRGAPLPSGVYFARLETEEGVRTMKVTLAK